MPKVPIGGVLARLKARVGQPGTLGRVKAAILVRPPARVAGGAPMPGPATGVLPRAVQLMQQRGYGPDEM